MDETHDDVLKWHCWPIFLPFNRCLKGNMGCVQIGIMFIFLITFIDVTVALSLIQHVFPVALRSAAFNVFYRTWFVQMVYFWHFCQKTCRIKSF